MSMFAVGGAHRVGEFLHSHIPHRADWRRVSAPHATLAVGYASTVVLASPVGYTLMFVAYTVTVVCELRQARRVHVAHVGLAVAYISTVVLYPAGITLVGAAYAFSVLSEKD